MHDGVLYVCLGQSQLCVVWSVGVSLLVALFATGGAIRTGQGTAQHYGSETDSGGGVGGVNTTSIMRVFFNTLVGGGSFQWCSNY